MPHILIVDDDDRIRQLVSRFLRENGFVVTAAAHAAEAEAFMTRLAFDALVVDIMMPGQNGLDFTRALRTRTDVPVLLLTALGEVDDRITGFETGADDYLSKPFEPRELVLRLQAILRRRPQATAHVRKIIMGRWMYDPDIGALVSAEETVRLTTVENTLLQALASNRGDVISREDLADLCAVDAETRTIDVQVTRLRRKLEDDSKTPRYLQTIRGKGYRLLTDGDAG